MCDSCSLSDNLWVPFFLTYKRFQVYIKNLQKKSSLTEWNLGVHSPAWVPCFYINVPICWLRQIKRVLLLNDSISSLICIYHEFEFISFTYLFVYSMMMARNIYGKINCLLLHRCVIAISQVSRCPSIWEEKKWHLGVLIFISCLQSYPYRYKHQLLYVVSAHTKKAVRHPIGLATIYISEWHKVDTWISCY